MRFLLLFIIALSIGGCTPNHPEKVVTDDGVTIDYQIHGQGDTTLLFLHGWSINKSYWANQVSAFSPAYKVVVIDHAGHGGSSGQHKEWTPQRLGKDVAQTIEQLSLDHVIIIGHSMSGDIMLETQALVPDNVIGLIGVDNFKEVGQAMTEEQVSQMKEFLDYFSLHYSEVADQYVRNGLFVENSPPEAVERVVKDVLQMDSVVSVDIIEQLVWYQPREADLLRNLRCKLYLLNSSFSPTDTTGLARTCLSGFQIIDIGPTGHYPMIEDTERFNHGLREALHQIARH